ncbi:MAG TPA: DUF523 and DUF1722 domain-containing protein [Nitrospinota bacterium]|nr:DUF523 and DUF1722 domain-containing protein [Nitrospinota bacterium]MDP7505375.1 DUF523 and DUF1722 domain-containing protein [Nitrospinota bacterium]MDP7663950.1 DUF523 and DUF1722 domain-containing protein [Nitrospinota bacterium]HJP14884.1 DUF523 and DUF1722 domain-containing protein [Nitrospinota bacterium]
MRKFPRPIVVVSGCLELAPCRWDGARIPCPLILRLKPFARLIPVCPEEAIGLGTPRDPIRLLRGGTSTDLIQPATGARLTRKMRGFAKNYLEGIPAADGFILKSRSPSCGVRDAKIFSDARANHPLGKGPGLFARAVLDRFGPLAIDDEARLSSPAARDHFLTKLFTLAAFRRVKERPSMPALRRFLAENRLLLMAHSTRAARRIERLTSNPDQLPAPSLIAAVEPHLRLALSRRVPKARRGLFALPYPEALRHFTEAASSPG